MKINISIWSIQHSKWVHQIDEDVEIDPKQLEDLVQVEPLPERRMYRIELHDLQKTVYVINPFMFDKVTNQG